MIHISSAIISFKGHMALPESQKKLMRKLVLFVFVVLGFTVVGFAQSSQGKTLQPKVKTPTMITIYDPSEILVEVKPGDFSVTIKIPQITKEAYDSGAVMVYIKGFNTVENYQALPFTSINRKYVYSYGVGTLTISSSATDNISAKIVILK